jgi:hypothetical protein
MIGWAHALRLTGFLKSSRLPHPTEQRFEDVERMDIGLQLEYSA